MNTTIKYAEEKIGSNNISYLYACRSCGAELLGTYDTSAVGFCPYCGSQSLIRSRVTGDYKIDYIIPFSKSKEECCNEYMSFIRHIPLTPNALKNKEYIKAIRGIYVPYRIYHYDVDGSVIFKCIAESAEIRRHVDINGNIDVFSDASIQLDDDIGSKLYPIEYRDIKKFNPAYLTGYYVEIPDVDTDVYDKGNKSLIKDSILNKYDCQNPRFDCFYKNSSDLNISMSDTSILLVPMYFLTYYNDKIDRVCYTIFSGIKQSDTRSKIYDVNYDDDTQYDEVSSFSEFFSNISQSIFNKEVYSEIPIDIKKYVGTTFMSTVILALLFFIIRVNISYRTVANLLALFSALTTWFVYALIVFQSKRLDKAGKVSSNHVRYKNGDVSGLSLVMFALALNGTALIPSLILLYAAWRLTLFPIMTWLTTIAALIMGLIKASKHKGMIYRKYLVITFFMNFFVSVIAFFETYSSYSNKASYVIMALISLLIIFASVGMCKQYNFECMRILPHFTRKGGHNEIKDL